MCLTDILLRVGFLVGHVGVRTVVLFELSMAAHVWRALLDEQFLAAEPEQATYRARVRYRLLPGIL